jgi:hypothetical protein
MVKSTDKMVSALVEIIRRSHQRYSAGNKSPPVNDITLEIYGIAFSCADEIQGDKEVAANSIVREAFHQYFSDIFLGESENISEDVSTCCFEVISNVSTLAIILGFRKLSSDECSRFLKDALEEKIKAPVPEGFIPVENLKEFIILLDHLMRKFQSLVKATTKYSESPSWFSDIFSSAIGSVIVFSFPWFPPSKEAIAKIIDNWFPENRPGMHFAEKTWALLMNKEYHEVFRSFPQSTKAKGWQIFPSQEWYDALHLKASVVDASLPEAYRRFIDETCRSLHSKDLNELVPLPVGQCFVAYEKNWLWMKNIEQPFTRLYVRLHMLCTLSISDSNGFPLPSLFSSILNIMGQQKMVKVAEDQEQKIFSDELGTFYKRMIPYMGHLRFVLDYHLTFWRVFVDKEVFLFQLPFHLFENLYMEIAAITKFHVKYFSNIVKLLNSCEKLIQERRLMQYG